ncbi:MAG: clostripain-related cysteine peptidase [Candidatus Wallbacteria bacterium]|nr:clostripain-related cysteine peptidase [Candidatus Wallbacteria bacterium]
MKRMLLTVALILFYLVPAFSAEKQWTVMVFLNGDNDLDGFGTGDVNEMKKVGSTDQINILVLQDHRGDNNTQRHFVKKNELITEKVGEIDMGDWKEALNFFQWGVASHPAQHYLFIIWNHGSGWKGRSGTLFKGISSDDQSGNKISTVQLGELSTAMKQHLGRNVDIMGYDACLMGMFEVAHETMMDVDFMVFSEETEPLDGWPYDDFLGILARDPYMSPEELSRTIVRIYNDSYNGGSQGKQPSTLSAVDCVRMKEIIPGFKDFVDLLRNRPELAGTYQSAAAQTQQFTVEQYKDLGDFLRHIKSSIPDQDIQKGAGELVDRFFGSNPVVIASSSTGSALAKASGLSIFIPDRTVFDLAKKRYSELSFCHATAWNMFLEDICYSSESFDDRSLLEIAAHMQSLEASLTAESPARASHIRIEIEATIEFLSNSVLTLIRSGHPDPLADFPDDCRALELVRWNVRERMRQTGE